MLGVFGRAEPELIALSDRICTALQLAEHCQDVAEDLGRGRIYLPQEDLERFGCSEEELAHAHAGPPLRAVLAFEVQRAHGLLREGLPLVARLRGRPRLAVAAFAAGGRAALGAIERAGFDVLAGARPSGHRAAAGRARRDARRPGGPKVSAASAVDGVRPLRSDHARAGGELLLRDPAALGRAPAGDVRGLRLRAPDRRHRRRRRSRTTGSCALLDEQERALQPLSAPGAAVADGDPVMVALADARTRFPLPIDALVELIEGVRMDVRGTSYATFEDLLPYCRHVAGTIGRLCLAIFGLRGEPGPDGVARAQVLADDLGVALQLTNILRDVREDAEGGRIYLPAQDLASHGLPAEDPAALAAAIRAGAAGEEPAREELRALVAFEAERAREWFDRGLGLADLLDRRSAACLLAMAGIYRRLLERIDAEPDAVLRGRVSLPAREKALVAVRGMLGVPA